jgi:hypothetical protein
MDVEAQQIPLVSIFKRIECEVQHFNQLIEISPMRVLPIQFLVVLKGTSM